MERIGSILKGQPPQDEPKEIAIIKSFVYNEYQEHCSITVHAHDISIRVSNGGLASQLQHRLPELTELCGDNKRLRVHIGTIPA